MPESLRLTVTGMTCGGCENAVKRSLSMLEGVSDVAASHEKRTVTLSYDAALIGLEQIARRIEQLGYEVES